MVDIIVKKTIDLSLEEKNSLVNLFNVVFSRSRTLIEFDNQYLNNGIGYSYHVFMVDDGEIVGSISRIPSYYFVKGVRLIFSIGVDAMILKKYRDYFYYYDMVMKINEFTSKEGVVLDFSFPNAISNPIVLKAKIAFTIGVLITYCLPYRIGGIKNKLKAFNLLSVSFSWIWIWLIAMFSSKKKASFVVEKDIETFNDSRYKRMDADYSVVNEKDNWFVYKIMNYQGTRAVFLIDVAVKSPRNFNKAIRYILKKHGSEFDIMLYIGYLPFKCTGFFRVPPKYEPKIFNFAAVILDDSKVEKSDIFNIRNWDVNLSNSDLI
jgi:hypothetical protein